MPRLPVLRTIPSAHQARPLKSRPGRNDHDDPNPPHFRTLVLGFAAALLLSGAADAAEVRVMISGGLTAAYQGAGAGIRARHRQQGDHRLRAVDGHHGQCDPGAAGARRARRRPDHGRLCARRSRQAGQGDRRQQRRTGEIADRHRGEVGRAEAGHQFGRRGQARAAGGQNRSPIPTAPAASMSRPKCSPSSASPTP